MWHKDRLPNEALVLMKRTISVDRNGVIDALKKSKVVVPANISDKGLYDLINDELISKENGFLVYHLGTLMNRVESSANFEGKSNFNFEDLFPIGKALGLFGKKGSPAPAQQGTDPMLLQIQMAQQQAQAEANRRRREDEARREEERRRRSTNMMIFGGVAGLLVIGTVIFVVMKGKKSK